MTDTSLPQWPATNEHGSYSYAPPRAANFPEPHSTSLSTLSEHDWHIVSNRWSRGIDWWVGRVGKRHWEILLGYPQFKAFPLFRTKTAAYEAATALILAESHRRAWVRNNAAEG